MHMNTLHCHDLNCCSLCDHCFEDRHPWYYCSLGNGCFGDIYSPDDCDDFEYVEDEDDDDEDDDDIDPTEIKICPVSGDDAVWNGSEWECVNPNCGWCGSDPDE